jgi:hypothetical protein
MALPPPVEPYIAAWVASRRVAAREDADREPVGSS